MTDLRLKSKHSIDHNKHTESCTPTATKHKCVTLMYAVHYRSLAQSELAAAVTVNVKELLVILRYWQRQQLYLEHRSRHMQHWCDVTDLDTALATAAKHWILLF
jgi:hypothetical protein